MKNFFKFFALAAFVLVAGVSCQDPKVDTNPAVLTVGEVAEVSAAGGNFAVTYSIENPVEGKEVTATVPAEDTWVSNITVGESAIEFTVAANVLSYVLSLTTAPASVSDAGVIVPVAEISSIV